MIKYIENSDLFKSGAEALVNPVNCKGVMGKGIALEFKKRFPECIPPYKDACDAGKLVPGVLLFVRLTVQPDLFGSRRPGVILFPTKKHWRDKSRIEWLNQGLACLKDCYLRWGVKSIAMPQIGCGLGGLEWEIVRPVIEQYFSEEPIEVEVYMKAVYDYKEKPIGEETKKRF